MWDVNCVIHVAGLVSYGTFPDYRNMERVNVDGMYLKGNYSFLKTCLLYPRKPASHQKGKSNNNKMYKRGFCSKMLS